MVVVRPSRRRPGGALLVALAVLVGALAAVAPGRSGAAPGSPGPVAAGVAPGPLRIPLSDGTTLAARLSGAGPLVAGALPPRPTIVELGPYGAGSTIPATSPAYNHLEVQLRGTGDSDGAFDALGPRTQQDVAEVLAWACRQPFSDGRLGLWGFSASAIVVYHALHLELPCVEAAVLGAGTHDLYRDLLYPGGVPNAVPGLAVLLGIGAGSLAAGPDRLARDPATGLDVLSGMVGTGLDYLAHPTLDGWWAERRFRGNANDFPILLVTGFFDVESRGPFEVFRELHDRQPQHHLYVVGAHDGVPAGTGGATTERLAWYDRFLRGVDNGVDRHPAVQLWLADGDRVDLRNGRFVRLDGDRWPLAGTRWTTLHLAPPAAAGAGRRLTVEPTAATAVDRVLAVPSPPTATDPHTIATVGVVDGFDLLTEATLAEPLGPAYTTEPFPADVLAVGPAAAELVVSSTAPGGDLLVVLSDVHPDGSAHPVATGRLATDHPEVDLTRSLVVDGAVVQPYGRYDVVRPARPGEVRRYHVELWPIGNRFRAGHRLRLHVLAPSALSLPGAPVVHELRVGGTDGSLLRLPVVAAAAAAPTSPSPTVAGVVAADPGAELPATGRSSASAGAAAAALALALLAVTVLRRSWPGARARPGRSR